MQLRFKNKKRGVNHWLTPLFRLNIVNYLPCLTSLPQSLRPVRCHQMNRFGFADRHLLAVHRR